jgi:hypothetical protein
MLDQLKEIKGMEYKVVDIYNSVITKINEYVKE